MNIRNRTWEIVEVAKPGDVSSRVFDVLILSLVFLNVLAVILGTVEVVYTSFGAYLDGFEVFSVVIFTIEYLARLWSCVVDPRYRSRILGRIRFAMTPMAIVDLLSILPFYLPFCGFDLRALRVLRLLRFFRIAKIGRYYTSLRVFKLVFLFKKRRTRFDHGLDGTFTDYFIKRPFLL